MRPPNTVSAGKYTITARATAEDAVVNTDLVIDVTGQPKIDIAGREGILRRVRKPAEASVAIVITNTGTAAAEQVDHRAGSSGWKVTFEPNGRSHRRTRNGSAGVDHPSRQGDRRDYVTTLRACA